MTEFGDELRRFLAERAISLSEAARRAGCSKGYLSNAASGRKPLTPRVAAGLDRALGSGNTFAAYALPSPAGGAGRGISLEHRSPAAQKRDDPERESRLGYALSHPANTDLVVVAQLREQVRRLDEQYDRSPAAALIAGAGQHLGQITFLQAHARRADVRRDLRGAEAEAATLMGQLVWDASQRRDQGAALAFYEQAVAAAQSRGDRAAEGLALLRRGMIALYGRKDSRAGLAACEHAAAVAADVSSVITGLAVLHAAEAHAMRGDRRACELALSSADQLLAGASSDDPAGALYSPDQPGRLAGSCYLRLGDARRASVVLDAAAAQLRYRTKAEAIILGNLALAHIARSQVDEAVAALHKAIDVIEVTWGGGGLTIVFAAARGLRRWQGTSTVREVSDRLLTLLAAS